MKNWPSIMKRNFFIRWSVIVSCCGVFCICIVFLNSKPQTVRLPGGTELSLAAVTHGPTNIYVPGGIWNRLICRFVPVQGINNWKLKLQPVSPINDTARNEDGTVAHPNKAALWIRHFGGSNAAPLPIPEDKWFWDIRATLADEAGEEWEMRPGISRCSLL